MWAVALVALLGVAAAVPSSIRLKEATLLVQRPRQEGHVKNWRLEAQQAKQEAVKAEDEAIAAEREFQAASDAEAEAKASVEAAAKEAAAADAKAGRREENQQMKREDAMEKAAKEQKRAEDKKAHDERVALRKAQEEEAFQKAKAEAVAAKKAAAAEARAREEHKAKADAEARAEALFKAGPVLSRAGALLNGSMPNRTGAALLVSEARSMATSAAEVAVYQAAQLDLKLSETQGRKVLWYQFQIPKAAGTEASLIAMRLLCEVPPHVTATLLNKAEHSGLNRKRSKAALAVLPSARCSMDCPARRLIDTQYSCATEGRTEQQPWENALYRVNTLLLNHKTVEQAVVFTLLREPLSRVVAHWLQCEDEYLRDGKLSRGERVCSHGAKAPPAGTRLMSNESFSWFMSQHADGPSAEHAGWDNGFRTANLQVGMLASVPKGRAVNRNDLKKAKRILGAEKGAVKWVVGTTDTMHEFYLELAARAGRRATDADALTLTLTLILTLTLTLTLAGAPLTPTPARRAASSSRPPSPSSSSSTPSGQLP